MKIQAETNNSATCTPNFDLPPGWRWARLGEVCEVEKGKTPSESHYAEKGVRIIKYRDIKNNRTVNWASGFRSFVSPPYSQSLRPLFPKTTLIGADAHDPSSIGKKVSYVKSIPQEIRKCYYSGELIGIRVINETVMDSHWPFFWFISEQGYQTVQSFVDGVHLNKGQAIQMPIPLPPIEEQKHIAAKLQELMQEIERARTACEKQLEATKALSSAYLREVFESEEAKKWERKKFQECILKNQQVKIKGIPQKNYQKTGVYPIVDQGQEVTCGYTNDLSKVYQGELPIIIFGDHTRIFKYIDFPFTIGADGTKIIIPNKNKIVPMFFYFALLNLNLRNLGYSRHYKLLKEVIVSVPSLEVQHCIATELKEKMAQVEKLRTSIEKQLETINALPQAILSKAFKGEL